ncbi:maleylpyruvate isomerase family mycothiol-dependent enzyme [Kitasatospora sp. NPDC006697]|uniref:maleylpyruvate isomerase family mycothiol-dependent enzyme n=1 Tax=Kitasatospora sp. NPDC006697 TaxID=3364020 RepID=UPI0036AF141C
MTAAAPAPERVPDRLTAANTRIASAIAQLLREGADPARPVPRSTWTVGEAAAHLAMANRLMAELAAGVPRPYGDGTPDGLAAANEESLRAFPERDPVRLAAMIEEQAAAFAAAVAGRGADERVQAPMGPMDLATLGSYLLVHQLGHGYDLARALGRPHMVDREAAELSLPFLLTAMPRVVDRRAAAGLRARFTVVLRGGPRFGVTLADGVAEVTGQPLPGADCGISCEPVAFLLLALGRMTPAQALLRGRTLAWGRRPWLAMSFPRYFRAP